MNVTVMNDFDNRFQVALAFCVWLKSMTFAIACLLLLFTTTFSEYWGIRSKKIFTGQWAAKAIQFLVSINGNFF